MIVLNQQKGKPMRKHSRTRVFGAALVVVALALAACGDGESGGDTKEGPTVKVASFGFPESVILAEIYAQALEAEGYPVEKALNLGSREVIFPSLESGEVNFLPEYVGSSLAVGFGLPGEGDTDAGVTALRAAFAEKNITVLDAAPGEDKNVFVVTQAFADEHGLTSVADLANVEGVTLGGPPECEQRETCYLGLKEAYGLDGLAFESIAEGAARVAALESGQIQLSLLFSTQPIIAEKGFVALEETEGIIAAENIVPVVSDEVADAYGDDFAALINSISAKITTEDLLELNGKVEIDAQSEETVAADWLVANGFVTE